MAYEDLLKRQQEQQDAFMRQLQEDRTRLQADNRAQQQAYLGKYTNAINSQESLSAMNDRIAGELGLPDLRAVSSQMGTTIRNLPQQVQKETQGAFVNAGQLEGRQRQEMNKLMPAYQDVLAERGEAEGQLGQRLQLGVADQDRLLEPLRMEGEFLSDQIARETTGFDANKEAELSLLLSKLENDKQLTVAEIQRAQALADAETEFQRQKELLRIQKAQTSNSSTALNTLASLLAGGQQQEPTIAGYTKAELDKMPYQKRMTILAQAAGTFGTNTTKSTPRFRGAGGGGSW